MATQRLVRARWRNNHGVTLTYQGGRTRFVAPDGALTMLEAHTLMGCTHTYLYRLARRGRLKTVRHGTVTTIPLAELRRLRSQS